VAAARRESTLGETSHDRLERAVAPKPLLDTRGSLSRMYVWIVLLHVVGAFLFVASHGASMVIAVRLRTVTDRTRQAALLEISGISVGIMYIGLALLLIGGIWAGFAGDHWGRGWIWAAIGVLVVVIAVMYSMATPFYGRMRAAAGLTGMGPPPEKLQPPAQESDLAALATSNRPYWLAAVGGIGLLIILWLMVVKPF
jgi:hypothetical protein